MGSSELRASLTEVWLQNGRGEALDVQKKLLGAAESVVKCLLDSVSLVAGEFIYS